MTKTNFMALAQLRQIGPSTRTRCLRFRSGKDRGNCCKEEKDIHFRMMNLLEMK